MPALWRVLFLLPLLFSTLVAAVFQEYRTGQPVQPRTAPEQTQPQPTQPVRQTPQRPAAPQTAQPQPAAPGLFGFGGRFLVRASIGGVLHERSITVRSNPDAGAQAIYCQPGGDEIGTTEVGVVKSFSCSSDELLLRPQIGIGYQWPGEGHFLTLDFYTLDEVQETLLQFHYTLPEHTLNESIPFLKLALGVSHTDSEGLSPTALSWGVGLGAYNWLQEGRRWRLEYGLDYTQREWLPINHSYGEESWSDREWHLYLGTAWRF